MRRSPPPTARRCQPSRWRRDSSSTIPRASSRARLVEPIHRLGRCPPHAAPGSAGSGGTVGRGALLENELLRVEIGDDGTLHHFIDKAVGDRDALAGRGNQLWTFVDKPRTYDAWDIEENYENEGGEVGGVERSRSSKRDRCVAPCASVVPGETLASNRPIAC